MTHKAITLKFVVPTMLAIAFGMMISIGAVHLTDKYPVNIDQAGANHSVAGSRDPVLTQCTQFGRCPIDIARLTQHDPVGLR
jgi:hypothetical protein